MRRLTLTLALTSLSLTQLTACDSDDGGGGEATPDAAREGEVTPDAAAREGYPSGGYGVSEGDTLEDHTFTNTDGQPFQISEIYLKPTNKLLLITTTAGWCTACREEGIKIKEIYDEWHERGLDVLMAVFEDADYSPATAEYAADWKARFSFPFNVVADTDNQLSAYYPPDATPMNMFVDVNDMKIISINTGWDESLINAILESKL
ncbi:TlpA family protein disulfide reductase [Myxococcota bacterium]|nr:TlpA family protein disulfide reductase [Myxococcota bacterium]MBU1428994.1 TlpA family protein disulfide reductase [Myxococcota bacterium]MBU1900158.1 TlpA family protein disulfide reductase [Myxococcota bacterium]